MFLRFQIFLLFGVAALVVVATFLTYTELSEVRIRCHEPSWEIPNLHFIYEITPVVFVAVSFGLMFSAANFAMRHTENLMLNVAMFLLTVLFSVFTFSLAYYQFGLLKVTEFSSLEALQIYSRVIEDRENYASIVEQIEIDGAAWVENVRLQISEHGMITVPSQMVQSRWDYVWYSLATALSDTALIDVKPCPSAWLLGYAQKVANIGFILLSIFIVVRYEPKQGS